MAMYDSVTESTCIYLLASCGILKFYQESAYRDFPWFAWWVHSLSHVTAVSYSFLDAGLDIFILSVAMRDTDIVRYSLSRVTATSMLRIEGGNIHVERGPGNLSQEALHTPLGLRTAIRLEVVVVIFHVN